MSTINQKEYLKKYLSIGSSKSKKKKSKKKPVGTRNRVKIIDDDIDVNLFNQAVEEDMCGANEDAPQIVGVIDDRPLELRIDDYRNNDMWKPVGSTAGEIQVKVEKPRRESDSSPVRQPASKGSDGDLSPVRVKSETDRSPPRRSRFNDDPSPKRVRLKREPDPAKRSGLQSSRDALRELEELKRRERETFERLPAEDSGAAAKTVHRDRKTGRVRDFAKEAEAERKKGERDDERTEKYTRWGRGLKQVEDYTEKLNEDLHEMSKPLARYADDEDLERYLKEQERDGDPMLAYMRRKKKKEHVESNKPLKPQYEGEFMPNRFGIRPGHRWDGVDRSNGYESRWVQRVNEQSAQQEDVYKWSTEDM